MKQMISSASLSFEAQTESTLAEELKQAEKVKKLNCLQLHDIQ